MMIVSSAPGKAGHRLAKTIGRHGRLNVMDSAQGRERVGLDVHRLIRNSWPTAAPRASLVLKHFDASLGIRPVRLPAAGQRNLHSGKRRPSNAHYEPACAAYRNWPDIHAQTLPSAMTNDSKPSTSGLKSAFSVLVAGQSTAGSCRAAATRFGI